jgi:hypothetical protein
MDIPERVNDGYSSKDIRTVDFLVSIVIFYLKKYSNKIIISAHKITCWIAQGSGFESQRGHLFFGISSRGEISREGFAQGLVSPPATSRYIGSVRIISEAPLVLVSYLFIYLILFTVRQP